MIAEMKTIIKPYVQDQEAFESLNENTHFIDDLKVNSANLVDIILDIEDKYDIEIDNDSMEKMLNVKAALEVVEEKIGDSGIPRNPESKG